MAELKGTILDDEGDAVSGATVNLYAKGTTSPSLANAVADSSGEWEIGASGSGSDGAASVGYATRGEFDLKITNGSDIVWLLHRDRYQVDMIQASNATTVIAAGEFTSTTNEASTLVTIFEGDRATMADNDEAYNSYKMSDSGGTQEEVARVTWHQYDVNPSADGGFEIEVASAGTLYKVFDAVTATGGAQTVSIGTGLSATAITLGHSTSEVTVADNLTVTGNATLNGNVTLGSAADDVITINGTVAGANALIFEGATADAHETTLALTDPTADATINLPAMSAGTYYLPVLDTVSTTAISSTPGELNILDGATVVVAEINYLDLGATAVGTAIASKAVILDSSKDYTGIRNFTVTGELDAATLDLSSSADIAGDLVLSGGADGALQFTNAGENSIKIPDNQASALIIEEANNAYLIFDTANSSESVSIGTGISGTVITLGHSTSEVTVADNLTVSGNLTVTGTTTSVDSTTINVTNAFVFEGATADAYETTLGIIDPTADATINLPAMGAGTYYLPVFAAASTTAISSTPEELNLLDGVSGLVQADLTKLAAIDATDSEIDLLDGSAKSTSSITIDDADAFIVIDGTTTKQIPASDLSAYVVAEGSMSSFQLEDDDGTEVTINNANEIKLIGSGITTNWTDTDNGTDGDPYDMTFTVDAAQTGITSVYNTSLKMGRDSQNLIDFATTDDKIILRVANVDEVELVANVLQPTTNDGVALGTTSLGWSDLHLATAGVINWANGEMTITEGADVLTVAGGTFATAALTAIGALTVGVDDTGHDVKFFGASAGAYMEWDQSADQLRIMGKSADATDSTGKLLLATSNTNVNANDVIGKIDFQAPHETGTDAITVAASIQAIAQGTFGAAVNATDLIFYTGHSEAATEKFRMTSQGELGIGGANYGTDGQVLTSGGAAAAAAWEDAGGGGETFILKSSDGTAVNNTTTYASDSDLTFAVAANKHYRVHGVLFFKENNVTQKSQWSLPTNATWYGPVEGYGVISLYGASTWPFIWDSEEDDSITVYLAYENRNLVKFDVLITTGDTSGTAVIQYGQLSAVATDSFLTADSWMAWQLLD